MNINNKNLNKVSTIKFRWLLVGLFICIILISITLFFLKIEKQKGPLSIEKTMQLIEKYCSIYENSDCTRFFSSNDDIKNCEQIFLLKNLIKSKNIEGCNQYYYPFQCKILINLDESFCFENIRSEEEARNCDLLKFIKNPKEIGNESKEDLMSLYFWAALVHDDISLCSKIPDISTPETTIFSLQSPGDCKAIISKDPTYCKEYYIGLLKK